MSKKAFETLFLKKRLVYSGRSNQYERRDISNENYEVTVISDKDSDQLKENHLDFLIDNLGEKTVQERLERDICTLFLVTTKEENVPVGASWGLHPTEETVWHDKIPVAPGTTLLFNGFIHEDHRRQGIFKLLHFTSVNYVFDNICDRFIAVLEETNEPIISAYEQFGWNHDNSNYLVKIIGLNVFSIVDRRDDREVHFVPVKDQIP